MGWLRWMRYAPLPEKYLELVSEPTRRTEDAEIGSSNAGPTPSRRRWRPAARRVRSASNARRSTALFWKFNDQRGAMEFFRVSRNVWGQETIQGISWDLLPVFFWIAVLVIASHAVYCWLYAGRRK